MTENQHRTAPAPGSIVVGIDGSAGAERALAWAVEQAEAEDRTLTLLHGAGEWALGGAVLRQGDLADVGELLDQLRAADLEMMQRVSHAVRRDHPHLPLEVMHVDTDARTALVDASRRAHLVVVGSRGRGPVAGLLLGSVSRYVATHAECPVAVCREHEGHDTSRGVVVGVDWTPESVAVAEQGFRLASVRGRPLTVVHALFHVPPALADRPLLEVDDQEGLGVLLSESVAGLREKYPDVPVRFELRRGLADECLAGAASHADIVVVGRAHHDVVTRILDGTTAIAVLEHAHGTVVVVPEPTAGSWTRATGD